MRQYGLKHIVTSTIHASMGNTIYKIALRLIDKMIELQDKDQILVALTRTKLGKI